jgi:HEPN domain-containing protein
MKDKTKNWIDFAKTDINAASELLKETEYNNIVLFHCQQSVEKVIKAIYEEMNIAVPKIHNLVKLYSSLPNNIKMEINLKIDELDILDTVYIDSRYPSEIGFLPNGFPSNEKTKFIFEFSKKITIKIFSVLSKK